MAAFQIIPGVWWCFDDQGRGIGYQIKKMPFLGVWFRRAGKEGGVIKKNEIARKCRPRTGNFN